MEYTERDLKAEFQKDTGWSWEASKRSLNDYYTWCIEKLLEYKNNERDKS